jgi:hypothetical protein
MPGPGASVDARAIIMGIPVAQAVASPDELAAWLLLLRVPKKTESVPSERWEGLNEVGDSQETDGGDFGEHSRA